MELTELQILISLGVFSTLILSVFLRCIRALGFYSLSLTKSIQGLVTGSKSKISSFLSWTIHLTFGVFFSLLYTVIFKGLANTSQYTLDYVYVGALLGFFHGFMFAFIFFVLFGIIIKLQSIATAFF